MQSWWCEPDAITYNTFIDELCTGGRIDDTYKLLEEMICKDCMDIVTYNTLLHGLCKAGRVDEAYKLFKEIQASSTLHCKVRPNYVTYTTLLSATQWWSMPSAENRAFFRIYFKLGYLTQYCIGPYEIQKILARLAQYLLH